MVEVFITNITITTHAEKTVKVLKNDFPELKIDFDMDETGSPYPCGHTVLRVEGMRFNTERIISIINSEGFLCEIMKDEICT